MRGRGYSGGMGQGGAVQAGYRLWAREDVWGSGYKTDLKKEMLFFSDVDTVSPACIRWSEIGFQRHNSTYRMFISLCRFVLARGKDWWKRK